MIERIKQVNGVRFDADGYVEDFWPHYQKIRDVFWKLETYQHFQEPDVPSWRAFHEGDWQRSVELMADMREDARAELADGDFARRRVRLVNLPLTPYLQWELTFLRLRAQVGEEIRVVGYDDLGEYGPPGALPEIVILGGVAVYEVLFDANSVLAGARRVDDPDVVAASSADLEALFGRGEDIQKFYDREVRDLAPPGPAVG